MESVQKQLTLVSAKVDALQEVIEQLHRQLATVLPDSAQAAEISPSFSQASATFSHKDVLVENNTFDISGEARGDQPISSEIQIQRLTAQLTAAYNRIAALEEQLLAKQLLTQRVYS
ncbi:MAG: hypothetical protein HC934_03230 [Acaryochloridaceae cyanobacterium SU_2_1]|nr:hypothetical protein [Acaryochloridaceae cyanobacterium SU_2_1]